MVFSHKERTLIVTKARHLLVFNNATSYLKLNHRNEKKKPSFFHKGIITSQNPIEDSPMLVVK
jgi:hypothetical protein